MITWHTMPAPDGAQPLEMHVTDEGVLAQIPRSSEAIIVWADVPQSPGDAVVVARCESPAELAAWMMPHRAYAMLDDQDHPRLAWELYQAVAPPSTSLVTKPVAPPVDAKATIAPPVSPVVPSSPGSFWSSAAHSQTAPTPPPTSPQLGVPDPVAEPALGADATPWSHGWILQVANGVYGLWRYDSHQRIQWLRDAHQQLQTWDSLQAAEKWAEPTQTALLYWTPARLAEDAQRTMVPAPYWYLGQLTRQRYCLWHRDETHLAVLADSRQRLLLFPSPARAAQVGRQRGEVAIYTPSAIWRSFLDAQIVDRRSSVSPSLHP